MPELMALLFLKSSATKAIQRNVLIEVQLQAFISMATFVMFCRQK